MLNVATSEMTRHPSMGDLFSVVSNKEVFLPPWRSTHVFLSPQCGRKNTDTEQAGEKGLKGQLRDKNWLFS